MRIAALVILAGDGRVWEGTYGHPRSRLLPLLLLLLPALSQTQQERQAVRSVAPFGVAHPGKKAACDDVVFVRYNSDVCVLLLMAKGSRK
jgi:hypothetical protein